MMLRLTASLTFFAAVSATPALVWKSSSTSNSNSIETVYTSEERTADDLLSDIIHDDKLSIVFVLGRDEVDGDESLTKIAPKLQTVSTKPANYIHQHVTGVQSSTRLFSKEEDALVVNLEELHMKLNGNNIDNDSSMEMDAMGGIMNNNKAHNKRVKKIQNANLLVVDVDANTVETDVLDKTIAEAIEFETSNVILTAVRGIQEVKRERELTARRRFDNQMKAGRKLQENRQRGRRRLEDQDQNQDGDENNNNNNNNQDLSGVYYVNLTPNIFAGILFMGLFTAITMTGISCMNMIIGQDTFTDKMPFVGREA